MLRHSNQDCKLPARNTHLAADCHILPADLFKRAVQHLKAEHCCAVLLLEVLGDTRRATVLSGRRLEHTRSVTLATVKDDSTRTWKAEDSAPVRLRRTASHERKTPSHSHARASACVEQ